MFSKQCAAMSDVAELSLELTNECTLACLHCSSGSVPQKGKNELSFADHMRLLREARALGATVLSLSGGNPLLYGRLLSLVAKATDLGFDNILIYTTGHSHHGQEIHEYPGTEELLEYGDKVRWIFSMHSHEPVVNDFIMNVPGTTAHVTNSITWLTHQGAVVEVHMVPMKPNFLHIPQMRDLCMVLGVRKLSLLRFVPQTRGRLNKGVLGMTKLDFNRMQMIIADELERNLHPVELRAGCPIDFRHSIGAIPQKAKPCHAGDDLILVRPNGAVHPCAAWKSLPSDSNVTDHNLSDIWHESETFNAIREFKKTGYRTVGGCASCGMIDSCMAGCPAQRLHAYGSKSMDDLHLSCSDPLCPRGNDGCQSAVD